MVKGMFAVAVITSVWSTFGHTFMSGTEYDDQGQGDESCLTCGAVYRLILAPSLRGFSSGAYVAANGDDPMACTGSTAMAHGYERHCDGVPGPGHDPVWGYIAPIVECPENCVHVAHNCNCLQCA